MHLDCIPKDRSFGKAQFVQDSPHGSGARFFERTIGSARKSFRQTCQARNRSGEDLILAGECDTRARSPPIAWSFTNADHLWIAIQMGSQAGQFRLGAVAVCVHVVRRDVGVEQPHAGWREQ